MWKGLSKKTYIELEEPVNKQKEFYECIISPSELDIEKIKKLISEKTIDINFIYNYNSNKLNAFQIICLEITDKKVKYGPFITQYKSDYIECLQILLENDLNILYRDPDTSADGIFFAIWTGDIDIVELTIKKYEELNISIKNFDIITTILKIHENDVRVGEDFLDIIKMVLDYGVDVNTLDYDLEEPPIFLAARLKFKETVQILCDQKLLEIDFDCFQNKRGRTARDMIYKYKLYDHLPVANKCKYHHLYNYIKHKNTRAFVKQYMHLQKTLTNDKKCSFLLRASQMGADQIVEYLLQETECLLTDYRNLLEISCKKGYYNVVEELLEKKLVNYDIHLIRNVIKNNVITNRECTVDCLELLLRQKTLNLNDVDNYGKTILQYAIKCKNYRMVSLILNSGASLIVPKQEEEKVQSVVLDIDIQVIEKYFDSCITTYEDEKYFKKSSTQRVYSINFTSLLPPSAKTEDIENQISPNYLPEMTVFRQLAKHPDYKPLLNHPVALTFVEMKWHRIRKYFYTEFLLYVIFSFFLIAYIIHTVEYLHYILLFMFIVIFAWEIIQVYIFQTQYFRYFENWLQILLIVIAFCIIFLHFIKKDVMDATVKQFHASAVFITIINFFFLIGYFPSISTRVIMVKTVYATLLSAFITYSIIILAFTSSFFILYNDDGNSSFTNYGLSFYKTILMSAGEYEATSITTEDYPVVSYLLMVLFVVLITIGLLNLLTGLAVNDIQLIKSNAKLYGQVIRIDRIARLEKIFLKTDLLKKLPFLKYISLFPIRDTRCILFTSLRQVIIRSEEAGLNRIPLNDKILQSFKDRESNYARCRISTPSRSRAYCSSVRDKYRENLKGRGYVNPSFSPDKQDHLSNVVQSIFSRILD